MDRVLPPAAEAALAHLRALPFVDEVKLRRRTKGKPTASHVAIRAGDEWHEFRLEIVTQRTDGIWLDHVRAQASAASKIAPRNRAGAKRHGPPGDNLTKMPLVLVGRLLPKEARAALKEAQIDYVDAAGNCYLALGHEHVAWLDGRPMATAAKMTSAGRGLGAAGFQVEFALLTEPALLQRPVRDIAAAAGVGKTGVAEALERLRTQGILVEQRGQRQLVDRQQLLDDWLGGYRRLLRPKMLVGTFAAADGADLDALQARLAKALGGGAWGFGGGIAAHRWTGHWRGELTVIHVADATEDLARGLKLLPARKGTIQILRAPFRAAIDPREHLAHPLLVYAELLAEGDERAREAAVEVRHRFPAVFS